MTEPLDAFDFMAFAVFAVLLAVAVIVVVSLGQLPGRVAQQRGHPQAAAVTVAGWLGVATAGILWPLALIWAFLKPSATGPPRGESQAAPRESPAGEEVASSLR